MKGGLKPLSPEDALEMYLDSRENEVRAKTLYNHKTALNAFIEWTQENDIQNINTLDGRKLHQFRIWRKKGKGSYDEIDPITLKGNLRTLQKFLEYLADIDAVEPGLREKVRLPNIDRADESSDTKLDEDHAEQILKHLETYEYAKRDHVIFSILWHTGIRLGTLRSFDLEDFNPTEGWLYCAHRPDTETPLKNGQAAERYINIGHHYVDVIQDYIKHNRYRRKDDYGRKPLITSRQGRLTEVPIRDTIYRVTQPCILRDCPHGKEMESCEYREHNKYSKCPSSVSPHAVRRGRITKELRDGTPEEVVSERVNSSLDVIEEHYDARNEKEKARNRKRYLNFD